jgi:PAS domain S-box-containing protein
MGYEEGKTRAKRHNHAMLNEPLHSSPPALSEEYALLRSELEVILDSIDDGIWVIDAQGTTLYVNRSLTRITGIKPQEVVGRHVSALMHEGRFTSCVTLEALKKQRAVTMFDDYAGGKRCLNTSTPIFDATGKIWRVVASIRDISELSMLEAKLAESEREASDYKRKLERIEQANTTAFFTNSVVMNKFLLDLERAARSSSAVLILGETGTGKSLAATLLHQKSKRSKEALITVNCAAIPPSLLEAELFGYEKGAFTGAAREGKKGLLELADKGTLFLDEIGDLPPDMQAKLLHVLDSYAFRRLGGIKNITVDVRILAATNKTLEHLVEAGEFRADLYYRLRVLHVILPPLREHPEDIRIMAQYFLEEACKRQGSIKFFDPKVQRCFTAHDWPGNVRELRATVEFLVAMSGGKVIKPGDLPAHMQHGIALERDMHKISLQSAVDGLEADMIRNALAKTGSSYKAAKLLGVSQSTVVRKAKKLGISLQDAEDRAHAPYSRRYSDATGS